MAGEDQDTELLALAIKFRVMAEECSDFTCVEELMAAFAASPAVRELLNRS